MSKLFVLLFVSLLAVMLFIGCDDNTLSDEEVVVSEWNRYTLDDTIITTDTIINGGTTITVDTIVILPSNNYTIDFIDDQIGWLAGDAGHIHKTIDGGDTWELVYQNSSVWIFDIFPISSTNIWAVGMADNFNSVLMTSDDGGLTCALSPFQVNAQLTSVSFIDDLNGYAVGGSWFTEGDNGTLVYTTDGGTGWNEAIFYRDTALNVDFLSAALIDDTTLIDTLIYNKLNAVDFGSSDIGFAVGENYTIFTTSDPDSIWTMLTNLPDPDLLVVDTLVGFPAVIDFCDVEMFDASNGWIVGSYNTIINTTDGGATWTVQNFDETNSASLKSVSFLDLNNGVAVGDDNLILQTTDGGLTWTDHSYNNSDYDALTDVFYLGTDKIIIVGEDFLVLTN